MKPLARLDGRARAGYAFLMQTILVLLVSGIAWALTWAACEVLANIWRAVRPRVRIGLLFRMFWLARQNWGVIGGWRIARMFERATRPQGDL